MSDVEFALAAQDFRNNALAAELGQVASVAARNWSQTGSRCLTSIGAFMISKLPLGLRMRLGLLVERLRDELIDQDAREPLGEQAASAALGGSDGGVMTGQFAAHGLFHGFAGRGEDIFAESEREPLDHLLRTGR